MLTNKSIRHFCPTGHQLIFPFIIISIIFAFRNYFCVIHNIDLFDYRIIYLASHAWLYGMNPYDHNLLNNLWLKLSCPPDLIPDTKLTPSIYPIVTYVLISPLAIFPWEYSSCIWSVINILSIFAIYIALLLMAKLYINDWRSYFFLALLLIMQPSQMAFRLGQPALLSTFFLVTSLWLSTLGSRYGISSGILLGLSLSLKPQIGFLFFLYYVLTKRFIIITSCLIFLLFILSIAIIRVGTDDLSWIGLWRQNLEIAFSSGGVNDPSITNYYSLWLINLQYPLYNLTSSIIASNIIVYAFILLFLVLFIIYINYNNHDNFLLICSVIALINLMGFYHRTQDAILLSFVIVFFISLINTQDKIYFYLLFIAILPFIFLKFEGLAYTLRRIYLENYDSIPAIVKFIFINIISYQSVSLFLMALILIHYLTYKRHS